MSSQLSIRTVKDLCRPLGRPGFAYDFPLTTPEIDPDDIKQLVGQDIYVSSRGDVKGVKMKLEDVSTKMIYGSELVYTRAGNKKIQIEIAEITLIEWSETLVKRITVKPKPRSLD